MYFWIGLLMGTVSALAAGALGRWLDAQAELRRLRKEQAEGGAADD